MYCYEIFDVPVGATRKPKNEPMNLRNFREQEHLLRIFPSLMDNTRINVFDMIEQYSARSLTRSTDKLNGFFGVLQAFHISPSGLQSFWGTPIAQNNTRFLYWEYRSVQTEEEKHSSVGFISGLCWTFYVEPVREKSLPSWSWVGWIGEIEYPAMIEYEPNRDSLEVKVCVELSGKYPPCVFFSPLSSTISQESQWLQHDPRLVVFSNFDFTTTDTENLQMAQS
jgi:hypothetical protein